MQREQLTGITITGADASLPFSWYQAMSQRFPWLEWGVLLSSQAGEKPIYPPLGWVQHWTHKAHHAKMQASLHLCGRFMRSAVQSELAPGVTMLFGLVRRVQLNMKPGEYVPHRIAQFARGLPTGTGVVLQHRGPWEDRILATEGAVKHLFDKSGGRGREAVDEWPPPPEGVEVGYAGGIGPEVIGRALTWLEKYPEARVWLDMEGRMRTRDGNLAPHAVMEVCERVDEWLEGSPALRAPCVQATARN